MSEANRVLVVEDEGIISMHIATALTNSGYVVSQAASCQEALREAAAHPPALALLDIRLGAGKDGVDTGAEISKLYGIPIVYLTGHADEKTVERAKATQPFGYLLKPFHDRQLATTVELAIRSHTREIEAHHSHPTLSAILETVSDAVILVSPQRTVQSVNIAAACLAGCEAAAAVGLDLATLLKLKGTEGQTAIEGALTLALRENRPADLTGLGIQVHGYRGDRIVPLHDGQGQGAGAAVLFHAPGDRQPERLTAASPPVENSSGVSPESPGPVATAHGTLADAPSRAEMESFLANALAEGRAVFAAPIRVDRFDYVSQRFGRSVAETLLEYYHTFLAQQLRDGDRLYHWSGPCFVVVTEGHTSLPDARKEVARFASTRLEQSFHLNMRSAVLFISANWTVIPVGAGQTARKLTRQIEDYFETCHE